MSEEKLVNQVDQVCLSSEQVREITQKFGGASSEVPVFSIQLAKFTQKGKQKPKKILITDAALYILNEKLDRCKHRVHLSAIKAVTMSSTSDQFVLHIQEQFDERFLSSRKLDVVMCLKQYCKAMTGKSLRVAKVKKEDLAGVTWTREKAKFLPREEQQKLLAVIGAEFTASDIEDASAEGEDVVTLVKPPKDEKIGLHSFELVKVIGRGSFAKVILVRKKDNHELYAMKIIKKETTIARSQVEHTLAERKILAMSNSPFVVKLRYAFQTDMKLYMLTDYYKGGELFLHLRAKKRFTEAEAKIIVAETVLGIGHLHSLGFLGRTIKPENMLVDAQGHITLTDFGLAKEITAEVPESKTFCSSSAEYAAPETINNEAQTKAVDWWDVGILLYELTVGIPPFYSQNVNDMYSKICTGPLRFPPFLSEDCKDIIYMLLNRNVELRLGSGPTDMEEIKAHPWFEDINWEQLSHRLVTPIWKPKVGTALDDVSAIDKIFTEEPVVDSPVAAGMDPEARNVFPGFDFGLVGEANE
jgi:serine/threonine protein kinase